MSRPLRQTYLIIYKYFSESVQNSLVGIMFDPVPCGTMVVLIKRAQSQAKKKTREEKCIQKLFLLLDGIRFIQEVKEGPDDPPILWINANKYIYVL